MTDVCRHCGKPIVAVSEPPTVSDLVWADELEFFDEQTLRKVLAGLNEAGITGQQAIDAISAMQNRGILFRELV